MARGRESFLEAAGALRAAAYSLGLIPTPPGSACWSQGQVVVIGTLLSDQIPDLLSVRIDGVKSQLLCGVRIELAIGIWVQTVKALILRMFGSLLSQAEISHTYIQPFIFTQQSLNLLVFGTFSKVSTHYFEIRQCIGCALHTYVCFGLLSYLVVKENGMYMFYVSTIKMLALEKCTLKMLF